MTDPAPQSAVRLDRLQRLHAWMLHAADRAHTHRRSVCVIGAPLLTLALVAINQFVLLDFPNSGDEYAYLYQGRTMATGRLWNPAPPAADIFAFNYIVHEPGRSFGSFPPGWPLALAATLWLRLPAWLVNPLLGTLTVALVWALGARLYNSRAGVVAAGLVAVSPFFLFNAASYFSHTLCGALLLGAAWVSAREDRTPAWVPITVGLLVGWAVVTRYFTGVVCGIPIALWLLRPGAPRLRTAVLLALGGLPWMLALLAYNDALTGSPWTLTTRPLTVSLWFADGFALRGADILSTHLLRHLLWTPPVLVAAYLVYLRVAPRETRRGTFHWMLVLMAATLYSYVERGGNQYGPRFHYEAFLFVVVFVAANLVRQPALYRDRLLFGLMVGSVALMPVAFAVHAATEQEVIVERMDPFRAVSRAGLRQALVLIGGRVGSSRSMAARDLTRNGIETTGSVLYGIDLGEVAHCAPEARLPGRSTYLYVWDHARAQGVLRPLECPSSAGRSRADPAIRGSVLPPSREYPLTGGR